MKKLSNQQVGRYDGTYPTRCAVSNKPVGAGAMQFSIDSERYVMVLSAYAADVTEDVRQAWRNQFKTSQKAKVKDKTDGSES